MNSTSQFSVALGNHYDSGSLTPSKFTGCNQYSIDNPYYTPNVPPLVDGDASFVSSNFIFETDANGDITSCSYDLNTYNVLKDVVVPCEDPTDKDILGVYSSFTQCNEALLSISAVSSSSSLACGCSSASGSTKLYASQDLTCNDGNQLTLNTSTGYSTCTASPQDNNSSSPQDNNSSSPQDNNSSSPQDNNSSSPQDNNSSSQNNVTSLDGVSTSLSGCETATNPNPYVPLRYVVSNISPIIVIGRSTNDGSPISNCDGYTWNCNYEARKFYKISYLASGPQCLNSKKQYFGIYDNINNPDDINNTLPEIPDTNSTDTNTLNAQKDTNKHLKNLNDKTDDINKNLEDLKQVNSDLLINNKDMKSTLDELKLNSDRSLKNQFDSITNLAGIKTNTANSVSKLGDIKKTLDLTNQNLHSINKNQIETTKALNDGLFSDINPFSDVDFTDDGSSTFSSLGATASDSFGLTYETGLFNLSSITTNIPTIGFNLLGNHFTMIDQSMFNGLPINDIRNTIMFIFALMGFITVIKTV